MREAEKGLFSVTIQSIQILLQKHASKAAERPDPSIFPLVPCCTKTGNDPLGMSLVCLVTDYLSSEAKIQWNSGRVTKGVQAFPDILTREGAYTKTSLLTIPDGPQKSDTYHCDIRHDGFKQLVSNIFPQKWCGPMMPPQVYLLAPSCEDSSTESQLELVCFLLSFQSSIPEVKWLMNGKASSLPTSAFSSATGVNDSSMGQIRLKIPKQNWDRGDIFTCQVTHPTGGTEPSMYNTSKCLACPKSSLVPAIYLTKPSYEDVIKDSGRVTCLVLGYDLTATSITWQVEGKGSSAGKTEDPKKNDNGTTSLVSSHPVSQAQWEQGTRFTCKVSTFCSGELTQEITTRNKGIAMKEPLITISKAYHEDDSGDRVSLTLVCEASGFSPEDISISWLKNNSPVLKSSYNNGPVTGSGTLSTYSILKVERSEGIENCTCVVHHPSFSEPKSVVEQVNLEGPLLDTEEEEPENARSQKPTGSLPRTKDPRDTPLSMSPVSSDAGEASTSAAPGTAGRTTLPATAASPTTPKKLLVELLQSIDQEKKTVTLTCIAYNYWPKGVTIKWQGKPHTVSERKVENGTYRASYHIEVPFDKWKEEANYACEVEHKQTREKVTMKTSRKDWMLPTVPAVKLHVLPACPSPGANDTVTLLCSTSGYYPQDLQLTWQAGGKERPGTQAGLLQGNDGRFSTSSNLTLSQTEWDQLGVYSCNVTHPGTGSTQLSTISKCEACQGGIPVPSLYLLKPSLEALLTRGEALLTCLAVGYELGQARVTWELDGANWTTNATTGKAENHSNQTQSLLSHLAVPRGVWDAGSSILCRVTHTCSLFRGVEATIQKPRGAKAPTVSLILLMPMLPSPKTEVWLTCKVSGFFPSELLIEWKRDNHAIRPTRYITLPPVAEEKNSTFSTQSYLRIPVSEWDSGTVFTCMVGHESLISMNSTSITVLDFLESSPPSVTVFHAPDTGGHETLTCFATGFYPKHLDMQWMVNEQQRNCSSPSSPTALGDGRFQQRCELVIRAGEWSTTKTYVCTVTHNSTTVLKKALHSPGCHELALPSASLQPPSLKELFTNETAAVTCKTPLVNASIEWTMDGEPADLGAVTTEQVNGSTWLQSWLHVNLSEWNSKFSHYLVSSSPPCSSKPAGSLKTPTIYLLPPSSEEICSNQNLTLHCVVKDFYPGAISIWWQEKTAQTEIDSPANDERHDCDHNHQRCSVISQLEVPRSKWILGTSYSCLVAHLSSEGIVARSTNVHTGNSSTAALMLPKPALHLTLKIPLWPIPQSFQFGLCSFPTCASSDSIQMKTSFACLLCVHFTRLLKR
nr:uncharacterized protein LOC102455582 [Pelodiscus sinensis]|eukprot:XP_025044317.1 uncharacterized protein LOC102455582 [Pelodiscus sinensis]